MKLPYSRQTIGEDDIREVIRTLKSPFITQGPKIAEFEKALARFCRAKYAVVFSSGTAALHSAYAAAGIGEGDEVIMPALTFAATANAALYLGATPVFVDIDKSTANMDMRDAKKKITKHTKAIVPVDYAGLPADLTVCRALAKKHKLILIEDGAQSLGAIYKGKPVGTQADMTMFSFHPVKTITTGEGGAVVTNSKKFYDYLLMYRTHGMTKDPRKLTDTTKAAWHQEMHMLGNNYRMTDIQAALGVSQMKKIRTFLAKRHAAARRYFSLLKHIEGLTLPPRSSLASSAWHLFVVRVDKTVRDMVFETLRAKGIGVQVHYLPVYTHPYYKSLGYRGTQCPTTEEFSASALSIPLFPNITYREQSYVATELEKALRKARF
ncbi:MAG: glutamine--scyllo-inositol transaminase [Parcubacteria group bacterium Gr01-1014_8]|nr:MAG: glutamine--scyllo-inositol transaminase [Parcubacteria group bacterium Gr01-1014_8]